MLINMDGNKKTKVIFNFLISLLIVISVTFFLLSILSSAIKETSDALVGLFIVCGFCFVFVSFVYDIIGEPLTKLLDCFIKKEE